MREIIAGVVAVIGRREEDRVQINCIDAKIKQIIQFCQDALDISPLETFLRGRAAPALDICRVIIGAAIGKTIGKDLVKNGVLNPKWNAHKSFPSHQAGRPGCLKALMGLA